MTNSKKEFNGKPIRAEFSGEHKQWLFAAMDICAALSETESPRRYWSDKKRLFESEKNEVYEKIVHLKMLAPNGKRHETDALDKTGAIALARRIKAAGIEDFIEWIKDLQAAWNRG